MMKTKKIYLAVLLMFLAITPSFAQTPISLDDAYNKALENNLDIKSGQLRIHYYEQMQDSYHSVDPLSITAEVGQINSAYTDNQLSISQSFRLPKFYDVQKRILTEERKYADLELSVQKWLLRKDLAIIYNQLDYLDHKIKLVKYADSLYTNYYRRAELRVKYGESNILEKTTAENYRSQAEMQLNNMLQDRSMMISRLSFMINEGALYKNLEEDFFKTQDYEENLDVPEQLLLLQQLERQKSIAEAKLEAEKAKLMPSFSIGLNSGTMRGMGADDKYYNEYHRFQSVYAGIDLPLFNKGQKSIIEGQKINQQLAQNNYELQKWKLKNQYSQLLSEYKKLANEQSYYREKGLANAKQIMDTANQLLADGEVNYLEWAILVNQSLEIQNRYIDNQKSLNEKAIEIKAFKNNEL